MWCPNDEEAWASSEVVSLAPGDGDEAAAGAVSVRSDLDREVQAFGEAELRMRNVFDGAE